MWESRSSERLNSELISFVYMDRTQKVTTQLYT